MTDFNPEILEASPTEILRQMMDKHLLLAHEFQAKSNHHKEQASNLKTAISLIDNNKEAQEDTEGFKISRANILSIINESEVPIKNTYIVDKLFPKASSFEKKTIIKNMAVALYLLERDNKINKEAPPKGERGNYYSRKV